MEIELSNGQLKFWQWDTKQKVQVPENVPTVHFKFGSSAVQFPVTDRWVDVPDELLQTGKDILLWTYKKDHTLDAARIPVEKRPKPAGYAYTPTEIKTWEALDKRIEALEAANVQANWDQNDASAADYVRGRTHYVGTKHDVRVIKQTSGKFSPELGLIVGNTYRVDYDRGSGFGVGEEFVCKDLNEGKDGIEPAPYVGHANGNGNPDPYLIFDNSIDILPAFDHMVNIKGWKIEGDFAAVKTLDLKYIDPELLKRIKALEDGGGVAGVSSVNGETGHVTITASGIGAATPSEVTSAVNSAWSEAQKKLQPMFDAKQPVGDYITQDGLQTATNAALAQAKASGEFDGAQGPKGDPGATGPQGPAGAGLNVTGATVGQTVKISAVDDNGVPTAWEPVDMASEEKWEKIADVALTADVPVYQLADFGTYRKVKVLISRSAYVSGLNKNVWFRVRSKTAEGDVIAATYVTGAYGYIALEINAEMGDMFTNVGTLSTNNRETQQSVARTIDVVSPADPSEYGLYMMFVDTSVVQSGDTVNVYGVKR